MSPKIQQWSLTIKTTCRRCRGSISILTLFFLFVFSALSLGMIYISQAHLALSGWKKNYQLLDQTCENGIKKGYGQLSDLLTRASSPIVIALDEWEKLKENVHNSGCAVIESILKEKIPLSESMLWEDQIWDLNIGFSLDEFKENQNYFSAAYTANIRCMGQLKNLRPKKMASLLVSVNILTGNLPLAMFPFLISKKIPGHKKTSFLEDNQIKLLPGNLTEQLPSIFFDEQELIKGFQKELIEKTFKIKIFKPQDLSASRLRMILGLESSEEPIPEGVYLIKDNLGLGGIFIQGDVLELGLAVYEGYQVASFTMEAGVWILMFSPKKSLTLFLTPEKEETYDLLPLEIIIVNGNILSLGGGIFYPPSSLELISDIEVPAILQGVNLTIVASDEITISTHLLYQGLKWEEGMPYIKESNTNLNLLASGHDAFGNQNENSAIKIAEDSPDDLKIQASLTSSGKGFSIEGTGKNISLFGGLQANNFSSNSNKIKIMIDDRFLFNDNLLKNSPLTTKPVMHLQSYYPKEWITDSESQQD